MRSIAIITARGGSKRIPKKNIRDFCGKPIIAYSIEAAIDSGVFDTVMVSTDSSEIGEIAKKYGAEVPFFRSAETSNDHASTAEVLSEVISKYSESGESYDVFACIYPTAPFITGEKLRKAMELLEETSSDSVIPVVQFSYPPQRGFLIEDGQLKYNEPEYSDRRSQDLNPIYHDCGQFYFCRTKVFQKHDSLVTPRTCPMIMDELETQDIDNPSDWKLAEIKYKMMIENV